MAASQRATLYRYRLPLRRSLPGAGGPVQGRPALREGLLVCLEEAATAKQWWSEISPLPGLNTESLAQAAAVTIALMNDPERFGADCPSLAGLPPSVQWGAQTLRDARAEQVAAASVATSTVRLNALLAGDVKAAVADACRLRGDGYTAFKLKIGDLGDVDREIERVCTVREAIGHDAQLRLDGNQRFAYAQAERLGYGLREAGVDIEYIEEPFAMAARDMGAQAYEAFPLPVALDESLPERDPVDLPKMKNVRAIILKPTVLGSIACKRWLGAARDAGCDVTVTSSYESDVGLCLLARYCLREGMRGAMGLATWELFESRLLNYDLSVQGGYLRPRPISRDMMRADCLEVLHVAA